MESRLIYESSKIFEPKIHWIQNNNPKTEWLYFNLANPNMLETFINSFFKDNLLNVLVDRNHSFSIHKENSFPKIKLLIGQIDFKIWDESFTQVIEVNKIGVYRTGEIKG